MDSLSLIVVAVVIVVLIMRQLTLVKAARAHQLLDEGAMIIDVRTPPEYEQDHLDGAVNMPLCDLESKVAKQVENNSQPILLYCLSGARSGNATGRLRRLGYSKVENLGSIFRARRILESNNDI